MTTSNLEDIWNAPQPEGSQVASDALTIVPREQGKEKRRKIRMAMIGCNLAVVSALASWAFASGKSVLTESWPALLCLATLWATYIEFVRFRRRQSHRFDQQDIRSVLQMSLRRAHASWREIKILLAVNFLTIVPMTIASVQMLLDTHKMTTREAFSFGVFSFGVIGLNIVFLSAYGFAKLRPQCHLLEERLDELKA